jgi:hypothetical protein
MSPAFSSIRQAAGFAALLLLLLLLPLLMGKSCLPPREESYASLPWGAGAFPYLSHEIFEEKEDIDIAFMGSSMMWWDIDTPQIEARLSEKLGRKAVVRSLCWNAAGADALYFIMQDLLRRRKVRCIVISDCTAGAADMAHARAPFFFRLGDNARDLDGLAWRSKVSYYTSAILGMPRNLLNLLRPNLPAIASNEISFEGGGGAQLTHVANPALRLGSLAVRQRADQPFVAFTPRTTARPEDVCVYSESTKESFQVTNNPIPTMQGVFLRKVGALAREHHVHLVFLHLPIATEINLPKITEQTFWPDAMRAPMTLVGIAPAKLFGSLSKDDTLKLYYDRLHLNQNGQEYFTSIIAPCLLQVYESQTKL